MSQGQSNVQVTVTAEVAEIMRATLVEMRASDTENDERLMKLAIQIGEREAQIGMMREELRSTRMLYQGAQTTNDNLVARVADLEAQLDAERAANELLATGTEGFPQ